MGRCRKGARGGRSCSHISLPTTRPSTGTGAEPTSEHVHSDLPAAARGQARGEEGHSEPQPWSFPPSAAAASFHFGGPRGSALPHQSEGYRQCEEPGR